MSTAALTHLRLPLLRGRARTPAVLVGSLVVGFGISLILRSELGLGAYDVLIDGVATGLGTTFGVAGLGVSALTVLVGWRLGGPVGFGTLAAMLIVGPAVDLWGMLLGIYPEALWARGVSLLAGLLALSAGLSLIVAAGRGAGPVEVVMLGLSGRGVPLRWVRTGLEVALCAAGWMLGGTVGVGTILITLTIGHLVAAFLPTEIPRDAASTADAAGG